MKFKVTVTKNTSGVLFQTRKAAKLNMRRAFDAAYGWYRAEVECVAREQGVVLNMNRYTLTYFDDQAWLGLDYFGYANGSFIIPRLPDGSPREARVLLCFQAPLFRVRQKFSRTFRRTVEVEVDPKSGKAEVL